MPTANQKKKAQALMNYVERKTKEISSSNDKKTNKIASEQQKPKTKKEKNYLAKQIK